MTYRILLNADRTFTAELPNGEQIGPYLTLRELERDMELLAEHIERKSFAGSK